MSSLNVVVVVIVAVVGINVVIVVVVVAIVVVAADAMEINKDSGGNMISFFIPQSFSSLVLYYANNTLSARVGRDEKERDRQKNREKTVKGDRKELGREERAEGNFQS